MRCQDVKSILAAHLDGELSQPDALLLEEHLKQCQACHAFQQRVQALEQLFCTPTPRARSSISTERIMLAVQQQKRITEQLEDLRMQQRSRVAHLRFVVPSLAAIPLLTLCSILVIAFLQPDLLVKPLTWLSDALGLLIVFAQYLQAGLMLVTRNSLLLSATAFVLVVLMGMWLRLMRHPREV